MKEYFYLVFGLALLFILHRRERRKSGREIWEFSLELSAAVALLVGVDGVVSYLLWSPAGREDFRLIALVLLALLITQGRTGPFFLALLCFSLWTIEKEGILSLRERFLGGLALAWGTGTVEWLLEGLRWRLKFSNLPKVMEGKPALFFLAALLFLALWGFRGIAVYL